MPTYRFLPASWDPHYHEILRGASVTLIVQASGALLSLAFNFLVARTLGPEGIGLFSLGITVATMCATCALLAIDYASLKLIAASVAEEAWQKVKAVSRTAVIIVVISGSAFLGIIQFAADYISTEVFGEPGLVDVLVLISLVILPLILRDVLVAFLRGARLIVQAVVTEVVLLPLVACLVFLGFQGSDVEAAAIAYLFGGIAAVAFGFFAWRRYIIQFSSSRSPLSSEGVWRTLFGAHCCSSVCRHLALS